MKKRMRSFLALFLALITLFGMTQQYVAAAAASTTKTVSTQKELEAALKSKTIKTIKISDVAGKSLKIPKGSYSKTLVISSDKVKITIEEGATLSGINVDKTNVSSQIIVNGTVKTVNVNKKATVEITGKTENTVVVNNKATNSTIKTSITSKVTSTKKANLLFKNGADNSTVVTKADVRVAVSKNTNLKSVTVEKAGIECNIVANGQIAAINVKAKADISVSGESDAKISVNVAELAKGSTLESSNPVDITANADVKVVLKEGAEGSKVTTTDKTVNAEINNSTKDKVTVETPDGKKDISSGDSGTVGTPAPVPTSTPNSGNNGGGSSTPTPSADPTPTPSADPTPTPSADPTPTPSQVTTTWAVGSDNLKVNDKVGTVTFDGVTINIATGTAVTATGTITVTISGAEITVTDAKVERGEGGSVSVTCLDNSGKTGEDYVKLIAIALNEVKKGTTILDRYFIGYDTATNKLIVRSETASDSGKTIGGTFVTAPISGIPS